MHISDNYVNTLELATLLVHTDTLTCTHLYACTCMLSKLFFLEKVCTLNLPYLILSTFVMIIINNIFMWKFDSGSYTTQYAVQSTACM